ncbi:MAG TPA: tetratricopeptide repeat protein [Symbiobacteriaceae bacterium]|jgi:predicted ATPase/DNA-binding SARP family transcriptional activator
MVPDLPAANQQELRLELLGRFRVTVGEKIIPDDDWRLRKARALLKLVALAAGHQMHRERVMDLLWPDLDAEAAARNLKYTLHVARRTLDSSPGAAARYLQLRNDLLALNPPGCLWIDVEAFQAAAAQARSSRSPAAHQAALDLYAGDLLPEDDYEDIYADQREGLRALYLSLLGELADLQQTRGELALAIETLQRLVAAEPTEEEAHQKLIRLYVETGQRHQALRQYHVLCKALERCLDAKPSDASQKLYQAVLAHKAAPVAPPVIRHNLPTPVTSFVGREQEAREVERLLKATRLLTLTGPGGCGKTRLALEVATRVAAEAAREVWLVELAALRDAAEVAPAIAVALGVRAPAGDPLPAVVTHVGTRQSLLILDNCEHLLETCVAAAHQLLRGCPHLQVLTTSRQALGVAGETVWQVPPLSVPDGLSSAAPEQYDALRLFADRARLVQPSFALLDQNLPAVVAICRRLDGLPLAIELAAAQLRALSPAQIAERLDDRFRLLRSGNRAALPRHQTLSAVVDWSMDLLQPGERTLFQRLAVCAGGFDLEMAEAVGAGGEIAPTAVLDLLFGLVDKSLVVVDIDRQGAVRYRLLETLREYGLEQLATGAGEPAVRERHAGHCLALAEQAEPYFSGPEQGAWMGRLEREHENLREALRWLQSTGDAETGLRLGGALWEFWERRSQGGDARQWLEALLARGAGAPPAVRAKALNAAAHLADMQGDYQAAAGRHAECLAVRRELGDLPGVALALNNLGNMARQTGDYPLAVTHYAEAVALSRRLNFGRGMAIASHNLGLVLIRQGETGRGAVMLEEAVAIWRELGQKQHVAVALDNLSNACRLQGDPERARACLEESLALRRELGDRFGIANTLHHLGTLAQQSGDLTLARDLCTESLALHREAEYRWGIASVSCDLGLIRMHLGDLPAAAVLLEESFGLLRAMGEKSGLATAHEHLGLLAVRLGDRGRARAHLGDSLRLRHELGERTNVAVCLQELAEQVLAESDPELAVQLWSAGAALQDAAGTGVVEGTPNLPAARVQLGAAGFAVAMASGQRLSLEDAVALALSPRAGVSRPDGPRADR